MHRSLLFAVYIFSFNAVIYGYSINPYWPLIIGNQWTLRNTNTSAILNVTVQVSPGPTPAFGCYEYPAYVTFNKSEISNYWAPGAAWNLDWYIVTDPDTLDIFAVGGLISNMTTGEVLLDAGTTQYRSRMAKKVPYLLIPGDYVPINATNPVNYYCTQAYPWIWGINFTCIPQDDPYIQQWNVTWTIEWVDTPAFSGNALKARFHEVYKNVYVQIEDWYFAYEIGLVKIVDLMGGSVYLNPPMELELIHYVVESKPVPSTDEPVLSHH